MVDTDFDFSGDEWFDEEVVRWNTETKRQYLFELVEVCVSGITVLKFIFILINVKMSSQTSNL